jgi:putative heme-binding domain-containing protein
MAFLTALMFQASAARNPWTSSRIYGSPEPPAPARVERVFPKLTFNELSDFTYEPATRRWFVAQLGGRFVSFPDSPDAAAADLAADFRELAPGLSQLLSFTFHPGFPTNRTILVHLTQVQGTNTVGRLLRAQLSGTTPPRLETNSLTELLRWPAGGHDGSCLKFGPDGMLYISLGDGSSPEPPDALRTGQDITDLLGSILRLDVDHADAGRAYRIPPDNPFLNLPGARGEVWAYGFRNPWRMGFGADGALWVCDVGWELWETVHRVTGGYNGGWALVEGPNPAVRSDVKRGPTAISPPAAAHPHSEAASITGGVLYRGSRLAGQRDAFVYGDWETGKIWALRDAPGAEPEELADTPLRIVSFAADCDGEIVLSDHKSDGGLYRLVPNDTGTVAADFPRRLSATGLFIDTARQQPAAGVEPYRIAAEMWFDGATAERWVAVPGDGTVKAVWSDDANQRKWKFPTNSVLAKTYSLDLTAGDARTRRRLETQVLHFNGDAWAAYTYRWNDAQTDAELVRRDGEVTNLTQMDATAPGGRRELTWRFASRTECLRCHNPWSGNTLGFGFDQLLAPAAVKEAELHRLVALGLVALPDRFATNHLAPLDDASASVAVRARSWLHVNCAHCHRWGAGGSVASFFNFDGPLESLRLLNQVPLRGAFGLADGRVIVPGVPERSVLWFRVNTEGQGHMPHIGSRTVDEFGSRVLAEWIESLGTAERSLEAAASSTSEALMALRAAQRSGQAPAATASTNAFVRELFDRFLPPERRRRTLGPDFDAQSVLRLTGDAVRGRALFHGDAGPQCARCHIVKGVGRNYGPDLSTIARKYERTALLDHIVNPSKLVAPEFVLHIVETRDGESLAGFVTAQSATEIRLHRETGDEITVPRSRVGSDEKSPLSAMPEGLLASLTAQEAAELLAYLLAPVD